MGPSAVIAKQGEYGAVLVSPEGFFSAGLSAELVVDPTGAGDSFAVCGCAMSPRTRTADRPRAAVHGDGLRDRIASFNVEEFGTERLVRLGLEEINALSPSCTGSPNSRIHL